MSKYFVWLNGLQGPEAQIWHDLPTDGGGKAKQRPLFGPHKLNEDEEKLDLDQLILKFKDKVDAI